MIYVTSQTILPSTIDYYLGLIPGLVISHARRRLFNPAPEDRSPRPLSLKLLERPSRLCRHARSRIPALTTESRGTARHAPRRHRARVALNRGEEN